MSRSRHDLKPNFADSTTPITPAVPVGDGSTTAVLTPTEEIEAIADSHTTIGTATADEFFKRGREMAKALDAGRPVASALRITFERPEDLARFLSPKRLELFRAVRERAGTIGDFSLRLTRSRGSLSKDLRLLEAAGLVTMTKVENPRHGRMKLIEPVSRGEVLLEARF